VDARVQQTIDEVRQFVDAQEDAWALPAEAARVVHAMVLAVRAQRCLEIGTSYGYSGLWIGAATAQHGGRLITLEMDERKAGIARSHFDQAGLGEVIDVRGGRAEDSIGDLAGEFDFVLNDADKVGARGYVEALIPKLADHAVVVTDNATSHADQLGDYLEWVRGDGTFFSTLIEVGNGLELSIRL
jgi:predicted O-methyltransferase YrrM